MARRGTNTKSIWAAGALAAVLLALTGYAMLNGADDDTHNTGKSGSAASAGGSTGPKPTYTVPGDWTEPLRWAALPKGARTDSHGSKVGFPHTVQGAEAMLVASNSVAVEGSTDSVDEQLRIFYSYVASDARTKDNAEKIELAANASDKDLHQQMGVAPGSDLPAGAYLRTNAIGFKVIEQSGDEVSLWLLSRVTQKAGETAKESATYTRTLAGAQWEDGDWKLSPTVTSQALQKTEGLSKPQMVAPGDAAFNKAGWTAIREAS
ncbi:hypothetical protein [Streptomyces collinus]|uniref:hypothetical protein n=1 Tax=Streptomyces collinus TaxID=42684 RepID=UPI0033DC4B74